MQPWLESLVHIFLPGICLLCSAPTHRPRDLCQACELDLPWLTSVCQRCSLPLPEGAPSLCGKCLRNPPPYRRCYCTFTYQYPIDRLILEFKENRKLLIGKLLATLMIDSLPLDHAVPDLIIPVPLHKAALRQRGFNQSMEIAEVLSDQWRVPIDNRGCRRILRTQAQKSLPLKQRQQNVRGAFSADRSYRGLRVAIVDDVITTGSTVNELARLITERGAAAIHVFCIARTKPK